MRGFADENVCQTAVRMENPRRPGRSVEPGLFRGKKTVRSSYICHRSFLQFRQEFDILYPICKPPRTG